MRALYPLRWWLVVWVTALATGFGSIEFYNSRAGRTSAAVSAAESLRSPVGKDHLLLIVFVHPRCACSRATLAELDRLMAKANGRLESRVYFVQQPGRDEAWLKSSLWSMVSRMPGVEARIDHGGIASEFDAWTSGQSFLFSADGTLLFKGGLTASRGHEGESAGQTAVLSFLSGRSLASEKPLITSVFGCALKSAEDDEEPL